MKIDEIEWAQGRQIEVYDEGIVIHGFFGEAITVANAHLSDLIFTLTNIEQERDSNEQL